MTEDPYSKWEERGEKAAQEFTEKPVRTGVKWLVWFVGACIALSIVFGLISWVGSWGGEAKRIVSVENVKDQNTQIIQDWEDLQAAASNACEVSVGQSSDDDPTLIENPALAYNATYRRIAVDYNRRMHNLFEAQIVRKVPVPSNLRSYPKTAPTLKEMQAKVC